MNVQRTETHPTEIMNTPNDDQTTEEQIEAKERGREGLGEPAGYALVYVPQWQEKLGWKLFPNTYTEMPEMPDMKDGLVCGITVTLSWLDRLRMLVSGKLEVTAKTATENVIGANVTATEMDDPFGEDNDEIPNPLEWACPKCKGAACLSYYLCDVEPYPFKETLKECHECGHMWEDSLPPNA